MQPTSLIFVAIIVIWAAFLLQHWIRRREALVTARTVDQFSDAMRVLERRGASAAVVRAGDQPAESTPARTDTPRPRTSLRAGTVMTGEAPRPTPQPDRADAVATEAGQADTPSRKISIEAPAAFGRRAVHMLASLNSRRVRGIALLASAALLVFAVATAPFGLLPWWSPIVSLVLVGGVFAWLRREAIAEQRARPQQERRVAAPRAERIAAQPAVATPAGPAVGNPAARVPLPPRETVFDHARPAEVPTAKPAPAAEHVDGGWSPVPVPRPTYTMKERAAQRPAAAPAPDETPVSELPFDGLALDEELEELPAAWRVG